MTWFFRKHRRHTDFLEIKQALTEDVRLSPSPMRRRMWLVAGHIALAIGIFNLLVPVVPTSPLVLVAAYCYARGSRHFYVWLLTNPWFGHRLREWRRYRTVPRSTKMFAAVTFALAMGTTIIFLVPYLAAQIILALIGLWVVVYILRIPSRPQDAKARYKAAYEESAGK